MIKHFVSLFLHHVPLKPVAAGCASSLSRESFAIKLTKTTCLRFPQHTTQAHYISELLCPLHTVRSLWSTDQGLLVDPNSRLKTKGDQGFSVMAPTLLNRLPFVIKKCRVNSIKRFLKTHQFFKYLNLVEFLLFHCFCLPFV